MSERAEPISIKAVCDAFWEGADQEGVAVAGQVVFRNRMGKVIFLRIHDNTGEILFYARREQIGDTAFVMLSDLGIGDFVWGNGQVMRTKKGTLAIQVRLVERLETP